MKKIIVSLALMTLAVSGISNLSAQEKAKDGSKLGYLSIGLQTPANFSNGGRSYSGEGFSAALMFHGGPFDRMANAKPEERPVDDVGFEWTEFRSSGNSRDFALTNLHLQISMPFWFLYVKGGYGVTTLDDYMTRENLFAGSWKWGFGARLHFNKGFYGKVETTRLDGPGPVGFWSHSLGMEYHF